MNTEPRRDAATFDLERSGLPVALDRLLDAHPEIPAVLLVTGAGARQDGSGARAALALAGRMAEAGRRVVLGDLAVDVPALHEAAGVPNLEGMTDLFLFGASLRRVARQLPGSGLHLVTAGPVVADPMELTEHPRWDALLSGLARARAVLLVVVPADVAGLDRLVSRVPHAVVLARADEAESAVTALPAGCEVIGTLAPMP